MLIVLCMIQAPRRLWVELQHRLLDWIGVSALEVDLTKLKDSAVKDLLESMHFKPNECDVLLKEWRARADCEAKRCATVEASDSAASGSDKKQSQQ